MRSPDAGFFMSVGGSLLDDFIYIDIHDHETSEYRLIRPATLPRSPGSVAERVTGLEYSMTEGGDVFYILTNADGAKDFKIMEAPVEAAAERKTGASRAAQAGNADPQPYGLCPHLVWLQRPQRVAGNRHPRPPNRRGTRPSHSPRRHILWGFRVRAEYDTDIIRFSYSSMTTPSQLFDYDMQTRKRTLLKTQEVPSGHDPDAYVTRRVFAPAHDGEQVPVTLL